MEKRYILATIAKSFDESHIKEEQFHLIFSTFYTNDDKVDVLKDSNLKITIIKFIGVSKPIDYINYTNINANIQMIECSFKFIVDGNTHNFLHEFIPLLIGEKISPTKDVNILNDVLFIFEDLHWNFIKLMFNGVGIKVGGGSISRRNILSTCQYRLAKILFLMGYVEEDVYNSLQIRNKFNTQGIDNNINISEIMGKIISQLKIYIENKITNEISSLDMLQNEIKTKEGQIQSNESIIHNKIGPQNRALSTKKENKLKDQIKHFKIKIEELKKLIVDKNQEIKYLKYDLDFLNKKEITYDELTGLINKNNYIQIINSNLSKINNNSKLMVYNKISQKLQSRQRFGYRSYSTSSVLLNQNNLVKINTNQEDNEVQLRNTVDSDSYFLNYFFNKGKKTGLAYRSLNKVFEILKRDDISSFEAQDLIENTWLDIVEEQSRDLEYIKKNKHYELMPLLLEAYVSLNSLAGHGVLKKKFPTIHNDLNKIELLLLTYAYASNGVMSKKGFTNVCSIIGSKIIQRIYLLKLKSLNKEDKNKKQNENNIILDYKSFVASLKLSELDILKLGDLFLDLLLKYPCDIFEKDYEINNIEDNVVKIKYVDEHLKRIMEESVAEPGSLPMVCKPLSWSDKEHGGNIVNQYLKNDLITGSKQHLHKTFKRDILYKAINNMSSIEFCFNKNLLIYLSKEGRFLLEDDIDMSNGEKLQRDLQLKVAASFYGRPIYIPLQSDWRGRIYTSSFFASYQGGDLAVSLLEFLKGEPLTDNGLYYLKIYGANIYNENNISKSSYDDRIKWIDDNKDNILNMSKEFMLKAENKFTFAAFCLVFKQLEINPKTNVRMPVFLDATCSGIQHLAALIKDTELSELVNLNSSDITTEPKDIYQSLVEPINDKIRQLGKESVHFSNLADVCLSRKHVKAPIMTKTYNVTVRGIVSQLITYFKKEVVKVPKQKDIITEEDGENLEMVYSRTTFLVPTIHKETLVPLNILEIFEIAKIMNDIIFKKYPKLNIIYNYFIQITKLMNDLNLPVIWYTPSGLELTQNYSALKRYKVGVTLGGNRKTLVLQTKTGKINKMKQKSAIIPNIIHSLDAAHLSLVINKAFERKLNPIITVHDCFGTLPNNMEKLSDIVKMEFFKIYITDKFMEKFHNKNLEILSDLGYEIITNNDDGKLYILKNNIRMYIPTRPELGDFDLNKVLNSKYFIT